VRRGANGADHFARRVLALHARNRLVHGLHGLGPIDVSREVVIDADPVHLAIAIDLFLADDGDVVLRHARDDAGPAAGAGRQIDRHAPLLTLVFEVGIERQRAGERVPHVVDDRWIFRVLRQRRHARGMTSLHRVVILRGREQIAIAGPRDLEAAAEPRRVRRAQAERVEG
jgi:hypothetical protein